MTEIILPEIPAKAKVGVLVAIPVRSFKGGMAAWHPNLQALLQRLAELSVDPNCPWEFFTAVMEGGLVRARNIIAHRFKLMHKENPNLKWLLTLDDDIDADENAVLTLLEHRRPLIGALYTTRDPNRPHWVANFMHEVELQKGRLLQVLECGTGCKLHHVQVFTEIERLAPEFKYTDRDSGEVIYAYYQNCVIKTDLKPDGDMLTEDYFFDYLCRMLRIGIFVDTKLKLKHRGSDGQVYPLGDWPPIPGIDE